jgi:O-antigen ligase
MMDIPALQTNNPSRAFLLMFCAVLILALWLEQWWLMAIPIGAIAVMVGVRWPKVLFTAIFASIPFSIELYLPVGLGLDVPDEPLMMLLTICFIFWLGQHLHKLRFDFLVHPISVLLIIHLAWTGICTVFANDPIIALKFLVAKSWYVVPFYLVVYYWFPSYTDLQKRLSWFFVILVPVVIWALLRHGILFQFSFADVNKALWPLFRNHVSYAAIIAVSFPFIFFYTLKRRSEKKPIALYVFMLLILFVAINFSYTRAAYAALLFSIPYFFIMKWKMSRYALILALGGATSLIWFLSKDNKYLNLAPRYEKAVMHTRFEDLLDATYKFQDISTMERVYRWVAGFQMLKEEPVFGFGPNNFYHNYQRFAVSSFRTYVSHNPEKSGVHNYYLMIAVEQGIPGLFIYLFFIGFVIVWGEKLYHKVKHDPEKSWYVLAAMCSLMIIHLLHLMNDLIETDKVGPFFFLSLAILVKVHLDLRSEQSKIVMHETNAN